MKTVVELFSDRAEGKFPTETGASREKKIIRYPLTFYAITDITN